MYGVYELKAVDVCVAPINQLKHHVPKIKSDIFDVLSFDHLKKMRFSSANRRVKGQTAAGGFLCYSVMACCWFEA